MACAVSAMDAVAASARSVRATVQPSTTGIVRSSRMIYGGEWVTTFNLLPVAGLGNSPALPLDDDAQT